MSHQVFVDKMLSVFCTPMVFLAESSFVIARSKGHPSDGGKYQDVLPARGAFDIIISQPEKHL